MTENVFGRRRFVRSTVAGVLGITGGMAATGTVAADHNSLTPGIVTVRSESNDWEYDVSMNRPYDHKPRVEKRQHANSGDTVFASGAGAYGHVLEGGRDNYYFPDELTQITANPAGTGAIRVDIGTGDIGKTIIMNCSSGSFDYSIDASKAMAQIPWRNEGVDSVSGSSASGFVQGDNGDGYKIMNAGHLEKLTLSDPSSSGSDGLVVTFE